MIGPYTLIIIRHKYTSCSQPDMSKKWHQKTRLTKLKCLALKHDLWISVLQRDVAFQYVLHRDMTLCLNINMSQNWLHLKCLLPRHHFYSVVEWSKTVFLLAVLILTCIYYSQASNGSPISAPTWSGHESFEHPLQAVMELSKLIQILTRHDY